MAEDGYSRRETYPVGHLGFKVDSEGQGLGRPEPPDLAHDDPRDPGRSHEGYKSYGVYSTI